MHTFSYDKTGVVVGKLCTKCRMRLPLVDFRARISKRTGKCLYSSWCKECVGKNSNEIARQKRRNMGIGRKRIEWEKLTQIKCNRCKMVKDVSDFSPQKTDSDHSRPYQSWCRECFALYRREKRGVDKSFPYKKKTDQSVYLAEGKKQCSKCLLILPLELFWKSSLGIGGRTARCARCLIEYNRARKPIKNPKINNARVTLITGEKFCTVCKQTKKVEDFTRNSNRRDGCDIRCKTCSATEARERYQRRKGKD